MYYGRKHDKIMIIGAGHSVKQYSKQILEIVDSEKYTTIGVNKMTSLLCPDYHLWTNSQRYRDFGSCINSERSVLMFGHKMKSKLIRKHHQGEYIQIVYTGNSDRIQLKEKHIKGMFRTAGVLAIAIAHLMEAQQIHIVGMDGYTYYSKRHLKKGSDSQHCYGSGHTDDANWDTCLQKDQMVSECLDKLSLQVSFKIITPTKFNEHYDLSILKKRI